MRVRVIVLSTLVAAWTAVGVAQLSPQYAGWADGPEGFLLTKQERKEWNGITTDAAARRFVELFWTRRDPNLETPANEFRAEFERRVKQADETFAYEGMRGALTDRGRVLVVMGTPHRAEKRGPTHTVDRMDDLGTGTDEVRANAELWMYDPALLPAALKVKGTGVLFVFFEAKAETNEYHLDRSHRDATRALRVLGQMPEVLLVHPDLPEVPRPVVVFGAKAADEAHLAWLGAPAAAWSETAQLVLEAGVADASARPLWAELILPADAPNLDELAGQVSTADGEVTGTFQVAAKPLSAGGFTVYHLTFPLAPGSYKVEVAGGAGGQALLTRSGEVELTEIPAEGTWLSPLWLGLSATREDGAANGTAYCFGGWHLVPLMDAKATTKDELSYFGFIVRPGITPEGATKVTSKLVLKQEDKRLGQPFTNPLRTVELMPGLHLYANAVPFAAFKQLGEYTLELTITDGVSGVRVERSATIDLHE